MKFSTECFVRCAVAWFFNYCWRSKWAFYGIDYAEIPKGAVVVILIAGFLGWYYLFRGGIAWAKGD